MTLKDCHKMGKTYQTVRTVPKFHRDIVDKGSRGTSNTQIHHRSRSLHDSTRPSK